LSREYQEKKRVAERFKKGRKNEGARASVEHETHGKFLSRSNRWKNNPPRKEANSNAPDCEEGRPVKAEESRQGEKGKKNIFRQTTANGTAKGQKTEEFTYRNIGGKGHGR